MATSSAPSLAPSTDGRARRAARSRAAIEDALFTLVGEGNPQPTVQQVAERAGVAMRSVFRHFSDFESLLTAVDVRIRLQALALLREPDPYANLEERIAALCRQRARIFELIGPYKRAGDLQRGRSPYVRGQQEQLVDELRARLRHWLPEIAAAPADVQEAVELVLSFEAWDRLRRLQRLGRTRAIAVLERAVATMLLPSATSARVRVDAHADAPRATTRRARAPRS